MLMLYEFFMFSRFWEVTSPMLECHLIVFPLAERIFTVNGVNAMAADDLAPCVARSSATMLTLNDFVWQELTLVFLLAQTAQFWVKTFTLHTVMNMRNWYVLLLNSNNH